MPSLKIRPGSGGWQNAAMCARNLLSILENERCNGRELNQPWNVNLTDTKQRLWLNGNNSEVNTVSFQSFISFLFPLLPYEENPYCLFCLLVCIKHH